MPRRNDISKILIISLTFVLPSVLNGQAINGAEQMLAQAPRLKCSGIQFLSQDGSPLAHRRIGLRVFRARFTRPHITAVTVEFKRVRVMKTDSHGQVRISNLGQGRYLFQLDRAPKDTFGDFEVPANWKPESCTQPWVLEDRGEYVDIHPAHADG